MLVQIVMSQDWWQLNAMKVSHKVGHQGAHCHLYWRIQGTHILPNQYCLHQWMDGGLFPDVQRVLCWLDVGHHQPCLMFVGKAGAYPIKEPF